MPKSIADQRTKEMVKALALIHGLSRAADIAKVNRATVRTWAKRGNWKSKETAPEKEQLSLQRSETTLAPLIGESYRQKLLTLKKAAELNLATYNADASRQAAKSKTKLRITQETKDLSVIHRNIFPAEPEQKQSLVQLNLLIGKEPLERV